MTTYVQQAARRLGVDALNLGLPGSCLAEPAMADYLAGRDDCDLITCELGVNMTMWFTPEEFEKRIRYLLATVADRCPQRPVVTFNIFATRADHLCNRADTDALRTIAYNGIVPQVVDELARPNLHFIDGRFVLPDFNGLTTDLIHPSDEGHIRMGENLAALLNPLF
jgi:lysophospholipase L1-like esterase